MACLLSENAIDEKLTIFHDFQVKSMALSIAIKAAEAGD